MRLAHPMQWGIWPDFDRELLRPLDDYYPTETRLAEVPFRRLGLSYRTVLDPGAGLGSLGLAAERFGVPGEVEVCAVELSAARCAVLPEAWEVLCGDFLRVGPRLAREGRRFDLVVTNPPFGRRGEGLWPRWVELCLELCAPGGAVLALGFANILGSDERADFWRAHPPAWVLHFHRRGSFTGDGKVDPRETLWLAWRVPGNGRGETRFDWL